VVRVEVAERLLDGQSLRFGCAVGSSGLVIDSGLVGSGRGTTRAEDAQGTPTQSHISPSILVYEDRLGGG